MVKVVVPSENREALVPLLMNPVKEMPCKSLVFSPNELVFWHRLQDPLAVVREAWNDAELCRAEPLFDFLSRIWGKFHRSLELAHGKKAH